MLSSAQHLSPMPAALPPAAQPSLPGSGAAGGPSFAQFLNDQPDLLPPPAHTDPVPSKADSVNETSAAPAPAAATPTARRKEASAIPPKPAAPSSSRAPETADAAQPTATAQAADDACSAAKPSTIAEAAEDDTDPTTALAEDDADARTAGLVEFTQLIGLTAPVPQAQPTQAAAPELSAAAADAETSGVKGAPTALSARAGSAVDLAVAAPRSNGKPDARAADANSTAAPATTATERKPAEASARVADAPRAKAVELAADRAAATRGAGSDAIQASAAKQANDAPRAAAPTDTVSPSFAAVLAQALPASPMASAVASAPAAGQVHAAVHSHAFAPELAASVSLLAVDGVQQAELQLNPADMGPVAVQIVVDGGQAQVSFHAVHAETRQALEQSLPDLAAALQGQGLTLSGGGVFQQSSRDAGSGDIEAGSTEGRGSRGSSSGGRVAATGGATAAPMRRAVGLLDTFA